MFIYHNNLTQIFIFTQKVIFCKIKFFISCVIAWNRLLKNEEIVFFLKKNLMKWRFYQIWWRDVFFVEFNKSLSSNLMSRLFFKFNESSYVKFNEMSRQVWWRLVIDVAREVCRKQRYRSRIATKSRDVITVTWYD
jgi:hypothetical protein